MVLKYLIWVIFMVGVVVPPLLKHYIKDSVWCEVAASATILLWSLLIAWLAQTWEGTDFTTAFIRSALIIGILYGASLRYIEERLSK